MRAILLALCLLAGTPAHARIFTLDDLLAIEEYGQTLIVPQQHLVLVEKRKAYASAADFAYDTYFSGRLTTRIMAAPLDRPHGLAPLFPQNARAGYWIGSLSPHQRRLAIFRLEERRLSLGVVDLGTRTVRWLDPVPDLPEAAPTPVWIDEDHLAYVAMTAPRLPAHLLMGSAGREDVAALWRKQALGGGTRTLVSTRDGAEVSGGERRLVLVNLIDDATRNLAIGRIVDVAFSPDRRRVAVVTTGEPIQPPAEPINVGFDSRRHWLSIVDVASARGDHIDGEVLPGVMSWSADDRLLVALRHGGSDWTLARWSAVDTRGRVQTLGGTDTYAVVEEAAAARLAYAGWSGTAPLALVRRRHSTPFWAMLTASGAKVLPLSSAARPVGSITGAKLLLDGDAVFSVTSGRTKRLVDKVRQVGSAVVDPYSRGYRLARDPAVPDAVIVEATSGAEIRTMAGSRYTGRSIPIPRDAQLITAEGGYAIIRRRDSRAVTSLALIGSDSDVRVVDRINGELATVDLPRTIDLRTRTSDGTVFHDWLLLPARTTGKPPLVINLYPGLTYGSAVPQEAGISRYAVSDNPLLLVGAGYAVLLPSMPLRPAERSLDSILPRIESAKSSAIASGLIDPERIGLQGHSFGAYAAMVVATRSDRYKAIVAANGPYDLFATHGSMAAGDKLRFDYGLPAGTSAGWTEGGQAGMMAAPPAAVATYAAASPMLRLDKIATPVLLIAGDLDVVDVSQSERAFMELYRFGKDAQLARYWGESHTNASPANIRDYWRLTISFLDEHLTMKPSAGPSSIKPEDSAAPTMSKRSTRPRCSPGESERDNRSCRRAPPA